MKSTKLFGFVFACAFSLCAAAENSFSSYCNGLNQNASSADYKDKMGQLSGCWKANITSEDKIGLIFDFASSQKDKGFQGCIISNLPMTPTYMSESLPAASDDIDRNMISFQDIDTVTISSPHSGIPVTYHRDLDGAFLQNLYEDPSQKCLELQIYP